MSVSTELFLDSRWRVGDIKETVESLYQIKVQVRNTPSPDYITLVFTLNGVNRLMSIHLNYFVAGFVGTLVTLGADDQAHKILTDIAKRLGGWYSPNDCEDTWQRYENVSDHNIGFLLNEFMKNGGNGRDHAAFSKYLEEWGKKHDTQTTSL